MVTIILLSEKPHSLSWRLNCFILLNGWGVISFLMLSSSWILRTKCLCPEFYILSLHLKYKKGRQECLPAQVTADRPITIKLSWSLEEISLFILSTFKWTSGKWKKWTQTWNRAHHALALLYHLISLQVLLRQELFCLISEWKFSHLVHLLKNMKGICSESGENSKH